MAQTPFKTTKDQSINKVWGLNLKKKNGNHRNKHTKMMHTSNLGVRASKVWGLNLKKKYILWAIGYCFGAEKQRKWWLPWGREDG